MINTPGLDLSLILSIACVMFVVFSVTVYLSTKYLTTKTVADTAKGWFYDNSVLIICFTLKFEFIKIIKLKKNKLSKNSFFLENILGTEHKNLYKLKWIFSGNFFNKNIWIVEF